MWIERLRLRNWRNFQDELLTLGQGLNALCGDNGAGKTNCLEAIGYLSRGSSFRSAPIEDLRRHESSSYLLEVAFQKEDISHRLSLSSREHSTSANYNGQNLRQWRGLIPTVLWLPQDAELIKGAPAVRRRFLDEHLHQCDPLYAHHWLRYYRILKQRNHLLRFRRSGEIALWSGGLAKAGSYLMLSRAKLALALESGLQGFFKTLEKSDRIELRYSPALQSTEELKISETELSISFFEDRLLKLFESRQSEELRSGTTLSGPHRDELEIFWNGQRARHFVSSGQAKLCSAGFKVAEWQRLNELSQSPVLLVDEFGSGLDTAHQRGIWRAFLPARQIIAACTTLQRSRLEQLAQMSLQCTRVERGKFLPELDSRYASPIKLPYI